MLLHNTDFRTRYKGNHFFSTDKEIQLDYSFLISQNDIISLYELSILLPIPLIFSFKYSLNS